MIDIVIIIGAACVMVGALAVALIIDIRASKKRPATQDEDARPQDYRHFVTFGFFPIDRD